MSDEQRVRRWCDLLGWEYDPPWETPGRTSASPLQVGGFWVVINEPDTFEARCYTVDLPTLAIATLVRHAGPVDVGPCPECGGHGRISSGTCPECWLGTDMHGRELTWLREANEIERDGPCIACDGSGLALVAHTQEMAETAHSLAEQVPRG